MSEQESRPRRKDVAGARTRTIAYCRVSTDKQADKGVSLEAQQAKVQQYAALYELELVETIVDAGASAKTLERPGLQRALKMLKAGEADALLVVKLDRLTRSLRDLDWLIEKHFGPRSGAQLLSVGEQIDTRTAAGRLVLNILAGVSQWEREAIGERTAAAMQHKQAAGEYIGGGAPFGFKVVGDRVEQDLDEQAVLKLARQLRAAPMSLRQVAAELEARGHRSRAGKRFEAAQVARMLS